MGDFLYSKGNHFDSSLVPALKSPFYSGYLGDANVLSYASIVWTMYFWKNIRQIQCLNFRNDRIHCSVFCFLFFLFSFSALDSVYRNTWIKYTLKVTWILVCFFLSILCVYIFKFIFMCISIVDQYLKFCFILFLCSEAII